MKQGPDKNSKMLVQKSGLLKTLVAASVLGGAGVADTVAQPTSKMPPQPLSRMVGATVAPMPRVAIDRGPILPTADRIARMIQDMEEALAPGGLYFGDLHDEKLTSQRLADIVDDMARVAELHGYVIDEIIKPSDRIRPYLQPKKFPGRKVITLKKKEGRGTIRCNAADISIQGRLREVTAAHCPPGTLEENEYFSIDAFGPDLAIKDADPKKVKDVLSLDSRVTDESMIGRVAIMDTIDRYNARVIFPTFYVRMSEPVMNLWYPNLGRIERNRLLSGFWFVAPPSQGDKATNGPGYNFQGESGNLMIARVPEFQGYAIAGTFHGGTPRAYKCENQTTGHCTTILFSSGVNAIRTLDEVERGMRGVFDSPEAPMPKLKHEGTVPQRNKKDKPLH